jgi:hypothetical protein
LFYLFLIKKLQFTFIQASGEAFSPQKRTSSTSNNLLTFFYVCGPFLPFWIRIRIANPDPDTDPRIPLNPYPIRIRSTTLVGITVLSCTCGPYCQIWDRFKTFVAA